MRITNWYLIFKKGEIFIKLLLKKVEEKGTKKYEKFTKLM